MEFVAACLTDGTMILWFSQFLQARGRDVLAFVNDVVYGSYFSLQLVLQITIFERTKVFECNGLGHKFVVVVVRV